MNPPARPSVRVLPSFGGLSFNGQYQRQYRGRTGAPYTVFGIDHRIGIDRKGTWPLSRKHPLLSEFQKIVFVVVFCLGLPLSLTLWDHLLHMPPQPAAEDQFFKNRDRNKDGAITLEEYIGNPKGRNVLALTKRFKNFDSNDDGKLQLDELKK